MARPPPAPPHPVPGHKTARLHLRALHEGDLADFQAYRHDPEVGRWQGWLPTDDDTARAFLREMAALPFCPPGLWCQLAIAASADDRLLGDIGLHLAADGGHAEIGYSLARGAQGQGLAQEAVAAAVALVFAHTPAQAVHAVSDSRNTASLRLLQRLGFRAAGGWPAVFRGQPCTEQLHVLPRPGLSAPQLRPADPHSAADADAAADVLLASRRQLMPYVPAVHADDDVRRWVRQTLLPTGGVTLAVDTHGPQAGAVHGLLALHRADGLSWIDQLYVHPRALARGVGGALLQHALAALPRPWRLYCFAANAHARGFYERHGFVALAHGDGSGNEEGCPDVLYGLD
jgi:RimJ/RimL family protein N-acetyltransferase